jgi:diguanylate cyclase (GGDEF)-like protein
VRIHFTNRLKAGVWIVCLFLLFIFPAASFALDPGKNIDQYAHDFWTSQNGLPGEAVYQVLQAREGYLWLRTSAGLVRFDGVRFVPVQPAPHGNPVHEPVKAICRGADGNLIVRTLSRTLIYDHGTFSDYRPPAPLPDGDIRVIYESRRYEIFIGSDDYIYAIDANGQPRALRSRTSWIFGFLENPTGGILISSLSGLYSLDNGVLSLLTKGVIKESAPKVSMPTEIGRDRDGRIWVGTTTGLRRLEEGRVVRDPLVAGVSREIGSILSDRDGNLWVGTSDASLFRLAGSKLSSFGAQDGLTDRRVQSLYEDREGSLWVGTSSGLDRFRDTSLSTYTTKEKLPSDRANNVFQASDGTLYVFCEGAGLAAIRNGSIVPITGKDGLPDVYSNGIFESRDGAIWLGTNGGLTRYKDGKFTQYPAGGRLSKYYISAINEDDESLIVATSETLALRFRDGQVSPFTIRGQTTPVSQAGNYTFVTYRDPSGTLWFGTVHGLYRFAPGAPPANSWQRTVDFPVTTIFDDHNGNLWLGGRVPGLTRFRIRDGSVTRYGAASGLFDDAPSAILADRLGNLWISTTVGIYVAPLSSLNDYAEGRASTVLATRYDTSDGMKTGEASPQLAQPAGWQTRDGRLWFGSAKGLVAADPRHMLRNPLIPPVMIEDVLANGKLLPAGPSLEIAPGADRIEIRFTSLSMLVPSRVRFKFKMEGYDRDWVDAGPRRVAFYTKIPPGRYQFRVVASNNDGLWNEEGAAVALIFQPHYYQTPWFYVLCGLAVALSACGVYLLRVRYLVLRNLELEHKVALRTDELLHATLDLESEKAELLLAREQLQRLATRDGLTGIWNRLAIFDLLTSTLERGARASHPTSVIMCDLDGFKRINDSYGHPAGDAVLREVSRRFQAGLRSSDFVGRYGGEEFLIVLPECAGFEARSRAEQLRTAIMRDPIELDDGGALHVTCSFGVSCSKGGASDTEAIVREADDALYLAKNAGKNRIEFLETVGSLS